MPPSSSLDPPAPFSVHSVDPEYCVNTLAHQVFSVPQTDLQAFSMHNGLNGQVGVPPAPAASDVEGLKPALLAGQPLLYVPSTSLFMLYGSLQGAPSPASGSERGSSSSDVSAAAELSSTPTALKRLGEDRQPQEDGEPTTKRQSMDDEASPLSLVMPKVREFGWTCLVSFCQPRASS